MAPKVGIGVGLVALLLGAGGVLVARAGAPHAAGTAVGRSVPSPSAPLGPPVTTGRFALGINEAVAVPSRMLDRGVPPAQLEQMLTDDAALARALGATLVRGHTGNFPKISALTLARNPAEIDDADRWVRAVQGAGLEGVLMVSPWPGNQTFNYTDHYVPPDMVAYEAYVSRVVERFDHDGVDDMPGLAAPVVYWEVDNEPDLKLNTAPKGGEKPFTPGTFCTPAEYAQVLLASSRAIHAAFPAARVLNGGPFRPHAETGRDYVQKLFILPGVLAAVDILSLHTYPNDDTGETLVRGIAAVRAAAPGKPLWVTETSVSIDADTDAADQGRQVVVLAARAAEAGAERLFWHALADPPLVDEGRPPRGSPSGFRTNSLLQAQAGGVPVDKPAGAVYRQLAAVLTKHDLVGATSGGDGVTRFADGSLLLWSGSRIAPTGGVDLRTGLPIEQGMNTYAPAWLAAP